MSKKKILMIHNFYQIGGGEHTVFENEVKMLRENGHEVLTYTRSNDELKSSKLKLLLSPLSTIWSFKSYVEVKKLIKQNQIDVVHCHNTFPLISPSVYYAARSLKVPVIQTIHNFRFLCPNGTFYREGHICEDCKKHQSFKPAWKHGCYRNSRLQTAVVIAMLKLHRWIGTYRKISYIFLTEFNKSKFDQLMDVNGSNIFIKPNFVEEAESSNSTKEIYNTFVFAGRLEENKGIPFLLDAWPELPAEYQLHIYGDGTYKAQVEEASERFDNIQYYGFKPQKDIFSDLSSAQALLFPSNCYETFGMTIAEAFSLGIPVVTTNIGNPSAIVLQAKGGAVFPCNDKQGFQQALEDVIANRSLYSQNARSYYAEYLTKQKNYEELVYIYDRAKHIK